MTATLAPPLVGCEVPRIFTPPLRKLTPKTSLGFACIEFAEEVIGITLLPWQKWLLIHALELLPDGTFRFRTVILLVARQNGKSTILQILALFFMYVRGVDLVIGTAQNLDIAEEVWQGAVDIAEDVPDLAAEIDKINRTNGKKALELRHGERYKVQAANRRGGRGLSGDLVMLDELREHQNWEAWGAVTKTTMARMFAQVWAASNAGDDSSVVLKHLRLLAHLALGDPDGLQEAIDAPDEVEIDDESLGIFEWSAHPELSTTDTAGWCQANPSLGHTITERAIRSAFRTDPDAVFRTEVLCQWEKDMGQTWDVIAEADWNANYHPQSTIEAPPCFAIEVSEDRMWTAIGAAGTNPDGLMHVEVVDSRPGTGWVVERAVQLRDEDEPCAFLIDPASPAGSLIVPLENAGIEVQTVTERQRAQACGDFYDDVIGRRMAQIGEPLLSVALAAVNKKTVGDAWAFGRKNTTDISPLVAVTLARFGFMQYGHDGPSVYEDRGLQTFG